MAKTNNKSSFLLQDIALITFSVFIAIVLVDTKILIHALTSTKEFQFVGSFVSGMFFTSIFTTAPAIVTLGEISRTHGIITTAFFGAIGAVLGDLIIFRFIRDRLSEHMTELLRHRGIFRRIHHLLRLRYFRWLTFLMGGLIIASPFPDELGISLLGLSTMKTSLFIYTSFAFNFLGIVAIGLIARSL